MKSKTINTILCKKFDDFVKSITDPAVKALVEQNTIITGGSIVSLLLGDKVNDYDLYFRSEAVCLEVAKYYAKTYMAANPTWGVEATSKEGRVTFSIHKSKNVSVAGVAPQSADDEEASYAASMQAMMDADETPADAVEEVAGDKAKGAQYQPVFLSSNAISLSNKVQLVVRFHGEPDQVHENYDFVHCTSYWTSWERKLTLRHEAMEAILSRELKYVGSRYPLCSIIRTRKFLGRGWTINAGQYVKMAWQIHALDLNNIEVLKDQLVGVDSTYFIMMIAELRKQCPDQKTVDGGYLMTLIDKLF